MRRIALVVIALCMIAPIALFAQNRAALTIQCNVSGAQVFVNGRLMGTTSPNLSLLLPAGSYQIKVVKAGVGEYNAQITLPSSGIVVQAILGQAPVQPQAIQPQPIQPQPIQPQPIQPQPIQPQPIQPQPIQPQPIQPQPIQPQPIQPQPIQPQPIQVQPTPEPSAYKYTLAYGGNGQTLRGATRGPDKFLVVGNNQTLFHSSDGRIWAQAARPAGGSNFTSVRWAGNRYIATGDSGAIHTSLDGLTWTKQNSGTSAHLSSALWTGQRFLVAGQNGLILGSPDSVNWAPIPTGRSEHILNLAQGAGLIVATGQNGLILVSQDGLLWTKVETGLSDNFYGLAYGDKGFVVGGSNQNAAVLHSGDGRTWSPVHKTASAQTLGAVYWDADRYLVGGSYGLLLESKDGRTWRELPKIAPDKHYAAFASGGGTTILVESNGGIYASASPAYSPAPTPIAATPPGPAPTPPTPQKPATTAGTPVPVTVYWHAADTADLYLNGEPLRTYSPEFRSRADEAGSPAFSVAASIKTGDVFTVGTRRGGSWGFMMAAVDQAGTVVWKSDAANWKAYFPSNEAQWFRPEIATSSRSVPLQIQGDPWYPQKELNAKLGGELRSVWSDPNQTFGFLYSVVQLPGQSAPALPGAGAAAPPTGGAATLGPNIAQGKSARQSSTLTPAAEAAKAVDGNTDGLWAHGSVAHTNNDQNAWWEVDLGSAHRIRKIVVFNIRDPDGFSQLDNFRVLVSEAPFPNAPADPRAPGVSTQIKAKAEIENEFLFDARGRYVRVQLEGKNFLHIAEVQVFPEGTGTAAAAAAPATASAQASSAPSAGVELVNLARGKIARQSSDYSSTANQGADKAVDGDRDQGPGAWSRTMTHTQNDAQAWWEVDLGQVAEIGKVVVYNRADDYQSRLDGYYLMISASPFFNSPAPESGGNVFRKYLDRAGKIDEIPVGATGRYVRIQLKGQNYLHLIEVEVYGKGDGGSAKPTVSAAAPQPAPSAAPAQASPAPGAPAAPSAGGGDALVVLPPSPSTYDFSLTTGYKGGSGSIAYGNGVFVSAGLSNFFYSQDLGQTWIAADYPKVVNGNRSVLRVGGSFVAPSLSKTILASPDGKKWENAAAPLSGRSRYNATIWTGSAYVIGSDDGLVFTSPDGAAWTRIETGIKNSFYALAHRAGMILAGGFRGELFRSLDGGNTWTAIPALVNEQIASMAVGGPGFIAGTESDAGASILFSPDGSSWSVVKKVEGSQAFRAAVWDGDRFLVGGKSGLAFESYDGRTWREVNTGTGKSIDSIATSGQVTMILSGDRVLTSPTPATHPDLAPKAAAAPAAAAPAPAAGQGAGQDKDKSPNASAQGRASAAAGSAVAAAQAPRPLAPQSLAANNVLGRVWASYAPREETVLTYEFYSSGKGRAYLKGYWETKVRSFAWRIEGTSLKLDDGSSFALDADRALVATAAPGDGAVAIAAKVGDRLEYRQAAQLQGEWADNGAVVLKFNAEGRVFVLSSRGTWNETFFEFQGPAVYAGERSVTHVLAADGTLAENKTNGKKLSRVGGAVPQSPDPPLSAFGLAAFAGTYDVAYRSNTFYVLGSDGKYAYTRDGAIASSGTWSLSEDDRGFRLFRPGQERRFIRQSEGFYLREDGNSALKRGSAAATADPAKAAIAGVWTEASPSGQVMGGAYSFTLREDGTLTYEEGGRGATGGGPGVWRASGSDLILRLDAATEFRPNGSQFSGDSEDGYMNLKRR